MSDLSRLPYSFPNSTGSVVWGKVDDAQLDDIINDSASPPVYRTQAAAEKRRRTVGMSGALKEAVMGGAQALNSATTKDKLAEGANYIAQPMLERAGNDIRGLKEALGPAPEGEQVPTASPPGMASYGGGMPGASQLSGMPGRVYDMARGLYDNARQNFAAMGSTESAPASRLPRGDVQDPLAGTAMRAPPPMSGEFPVERPDMAALAGSVPPALLAQSAARAQPPGPADDIQSGANAAKAIATPPAPAPAAAPGGPDEFSNMSPSFLEMAKKFVGAQEDAPLTAEDKWLALARAGFGMAASQAPSFGQALGEGAMSGITQLQQVRAQRAEQAARRSQMGLQVASTDAQLRQGDRTYELQKGKMAQDAAEAEAKKPLIEAQVNELRTSAALNLARAGATKALGSSGSSKLALAQQLMNERAEAGQPISLEQAIQLTFKGSPDISRTAALNVAMKAREMAEVSGRTVAEEIDGLLTDADRISGVSGGAVSSSGGGAPSAAPAVAASTTPIVVKSQKDIDNAPSGAVLIVNGQQFKKP
jgi:hypothetical protein